MEPLQGNDTIQQLMKLLEENNRRGQAADLSQLMGYLDYMSRQYDIVFQELREVRAQLAQEKQPAVHIPDRTCHVHGKNQPPRRRFSATSPEEVASAKGRAHTVRSTHKFMCDFNTGGSGNDGLPKDPHAAQQGM